MTQQQLKNVLKANSQIPNINMDDILEGVQIDRVEKEDENTLFHTLLNLERFSDDEFFSSYEKGKLLKSIFASKNIFQMSNNLTIASNQNVKENNTVDEIISLMSVSEDLEKYLEKHKDETYSIRQFIEHISMNILLQKHVQEKYSIEEQKRLMKTIFKGDSIDKLNLDYTILSRTDLQECYRPHELLNIVDMITLKCTTLQQSLAMYELMGNPKMYNMFAYDEILTRMKAVLPKGQEQSGEEENKRIVNQALCVYSGKVLADLFHIQESNTFNDKEEKQYKKIKK